MTSRQEVCATEPQLVCLDVGLMPSAGPMREGMTRWHPDPFPCHDGRAIHMKTQHLLVEVHFTPKNLFTQLSSLAPSILLATRLVRINC